MSAPVREGGITRRGFLGTALAGLVGALLSRRLRPPTAQGIATPSSAPPDEPVTRSPARPRWIGHC